MRSGIGSSPAPFFARFLASIFRLPFWPSLSRRQKAASLTLLAFSIATAAQAQLQHPQLTAISRSSAAAVNRGDAVTFRFSVQPGTAGIRSITFAFSTRDGRTFRILRATEPVTDTVFATVDSTWLDETYRLDSIALADAWSRTVTYQSDGTIAANNGVDPRENVYAGPATHRFDFSSLGFNVSGASTLAPYPDLVAVTALTSGTLAPGQTARFRYQGQLNAFSLASLTLTFRSVTGSFTFNATANTTTLNGEIDVPIVGAMLNGRYRLVAVTLTDRQGRGVQYSEAGTALAMSDEVTYAIATSVLPLFPGELTISGASTTALRPQLSAWRRESPADLAPGATLRFAYETSSAGFPVRRVTARLAGPFGGSRDFSAEAPSGSFSVPVGSDWLAGPYSVTRITVTDTAGNSTTYLPFGGTVIGGTVGTVPATPETFRFNVTGTTLSPYFTLPPPAETGARANQDATIQVRAVGLGPVTYQWFRGEPGDTSSPLSNNATTDISATGDRLSVRVTGSAVYWVRATSAGASVSSAPIRVGIVAPPVIVAHPAPQAAPVGGSAFFSVTATGPGPLTYQWRVPRARSTDVLNQPQLRLNALEPIDAGEVSCEVTNPGGTTTASTLLTVFTHSATLRITSEPTDQIVRPGIFGVTFRAEFSGNPPLRHRWQKDGVDLPSSGGISLRDSDSSSFSLNNPTTADEGTYRLVVTNGFETVYSREVRLRFTTAPLILTQPVPQLATRLESTFALSVIATGAVPLSYQWRRDGVPVAGATREEFVPFVGSASLGGTYDVVVSNAAGSVTSTSTLVTVSPIPVTRPQVVQGPANRTARPGETVTFVVVPSTTEDLRCIWSKGSRDLQDGSATSFTLRDVGSSDSGRYRVLLTSPGSLSGSSHDFTLTVTPAQDAPVITRQPADAIFPRGEVARLDVGVDGRAPLRFQWRFRGVPIPTRDSLYPANEPTLFVPRFDSTKIGPYDVVITSDSGTVTSAEAVLSLPPPSAAGRLMNVSVRAAAGGPHGPLIVGFVIGSGVAEPVPLLIRSAGNALAPFGIGDALGNPITTLYAGPAPRFINDDWLNYPPVAATAARVGAFPFPATAGRDAAFAPVIPPGSYTVHVDAADAAPGVTLAEIYDATPAAEITDQRPRLLNLSVQTKATGGNPLIAGFAIGGTRPKRILLRGVGPSLGAFGVTGALADPQLALLRGSTIIAENNDWAGDSTLLDAFRQVGAFSFDSANSKDAALVAELPPGPYTAQVGGFRGGEGVVLVEVYELP